MEVIREFLPVKLTATQVANAVVELAVRSA
jgi:hypothetical protein